MLPKHSRRAFVTSAGLATMGLATINTSPLAARTPIATPRSTPISSSFEELTSWLRASMSELDIPGAALGVVVDGQRFTQAIGVTEAGTEQAFTTSTRFGIASLTKIFTATALASLAHDGVLDLDEPVNQYLPDFSLADPNATATVTTGHLLSHAGGWADTVEPGPALDSPDWYATVLPDLPQVVPVGSHFSYSNSGYMLAGAVIEQRTGTSFADTISQSVLQPLGMDQSGFTADPGPSADRATGHQPSDGGLATIPHQDIPPAVYPTAGLLSSVEDMLTFVQAHAGIDPGQLNPGALDIMRQPHNTGGSIGPVVVDHVGIGWMLLDINGETVLMSQGGDSGLISAMIAIPSRQFGMVVLANSDTALMLCNDAVLRGMSTFTGLALSESEEYELSEEEAGNVEGQFGLPGWMTFTITSARGSVQVAASEGGQDIPDLSGQLTMTSPTQGFMPFLGARVWLDFVPDDTGSVQWLRFAGRMVPRIE